MRTPAAQPFFRPAPTPRAPGPAATGRKSPDGRLSHRGDRRGCKPSSVPLRAPIITLSAQPADAALRPLAARAAPLRLFGLAPEGVCLDTPAFAERRWALAPPFHPCRPRAAVCFCGTFRRAGSPRARRPLQPAFPLCGVRTFLPGRARAIGRLGERGQIRMRPQAGQVTMAEPAGSLSAWATAWATEGGWTRLQPVQTPSARLKTERQGQRVRRRRS